MVILGVFLFVMDVLLIVSVIFGGSGGGGGHWKGVREKSKIEGVRGVFNSV